MRKIFFIIVSSIFTLSTVFVISNIIEEQLIQFVNNQTFHERKENLSSYNQPIFLINQDRVSYDKPTIVDLSAKRSTHRGNTDAVYVNQELVLLAVYTIIVGDTQINGRISGEYMLYIGMLTDKINEIRPSTENGRNFGGDVPPLGITPYNRHFIQFFRFRESYILSYGGNLIGHAVEYISLYFIQGASNGNFMAVFIQSLMTPNQNNNRKRARHIRYILDPSLNNNATLIDYAPRSRNQGPTTWLSVRANAQNAILDANGNVIPAVIGGSYRVMIRSPRVWDYGNMANHLAHVLFYFYGNNMAFGEYARFTQSPINQAKAIILRADPNSANYVNIRDDREFAIVYRRFLLGPIFFTFHANEHIRLV